MKARNRAAFTLVELLTVIAIIGLLISILLPALGRAREVANRAVCSANQAAIMKGLQTFSAGNNGKFPSWGQVYPGFTRIGEGWDWDGIDQHTGYFSNTAYRNLLGQTTSVRSNTRNYYMLVRNNLADPKNFQCNSDPEGGEPFNPADPTKAYDFQNRAQVSFSLQYQGPAANNNSLNDPRGGWQTSMQDDPRMVIIADKNPLIRAPQAQASTAYFDYQVPQSGDTDGCGQVAAILKGLEASGKINLNQTNGRFEPDIQDDDKTALNSLNHKGEGQNVTKLDGSTSFVQDLWQGAANDNIWTVEDSRDKSINSTNGLTSLVARVLGVFPGSAADSTGDQAAMLTHWMSQARYNRNTYPDSFLVP